MKNTEKRELVLEVIKDGFRRVVFREDIGNGNTLYLEESDLVDFSRPVTDNGDFNVFFTKKAFWNSFIEYTSSEGLLKKQVWHEQTNEWLQLRPVFVHSDIRPLVQESLAVATRNLSSDDEQQIDGLRFWLRKLSESTNQFDTIINRSKNLRHAV
ncbi:MAG: hypothetical protein RL266_2666 [Bacteroidota bacterium]|jgi:hypothetical protein